MSQEIQAKAVEVMSEVETVTGTVLPDPAPATNIVPLEEADEPLSAEIRKRMDQIDMSEP